MKLAPEEWELIDDALYFWSDRISAAIGNASPYALDAAGRNVLKRVKRIREKIATMLPEKTP